MSTVLMRAISEPSRGPTLTTVTKRASCPRKRASSPAVDWIPACAGMTKIQCEAKCEPSWLARCGDFRNVAMNDCRTAGALPRRVPKEAAGAGFIAAASMKRAGKVSEALAREMVTCLSSNGCHCNNLHLLLFLGLFSHQHIGPICSVQIHSSDLSVSVEIERELRPS